MHRLLKEKGLPALITATALTLVGCPSKESEDTAQQFELLFNDRSLELEHRVSLALGDREFTLMPGESRRIRITGDREETLSIESQSALMRCNLGKAGQSSKRITDRDKDTQVILDCDFAEFFDVFGGYFGRRTSTLTAITDGTELRTILLPQPESGNLYPVSAYHSGIIVSSADDYYLLESSDLSLEPTAWNTENSQSTSIWKGQLFTLEAGDNGNPSVHFSPNPDTPLSIYQALPQSPEDCEYRSIAADDAYVSVFCSSGETNDAQRVLTLHKDAPDATQENASENFSRTRWFPNLGHAGSKIDENLGTGVVFSLFNGNHQVQTHPIPESDIQSVSMVRLSPDTVLIDVEYLSDTRQTCTVFYGLDRAEAFREMVDLCDFEEGISIHSLPFQWDGDLFFIARSETGQIIPDANSLVALRGAGSTHSVEVLANGTDLNGNLMDVLPTETGIYLYSLGETQVGCPLAPWACTYQANLYTTGFSGAKPLTLVYEGLYLSSLLSHRPLVSSPWSMSGQVLFLAATPEAGQELWRSDGTVEGTHMVTELFAGIDSIYFARNLPMDGFYRYAPRP